jgi:uncharacterized protein (DUF2249 family)
MMTISANTKIAAILKQHPEALEAIISISPKFEKLRNPFLRKLMGGRASIAMASKMGGCSAADFFAKLKPLGFETGNANLQEERPVQEKLPEFLKNANPEQIVKLDVRPVIAGGEDPLQLILETVKQLQSGEILEIINTFEPTPLMYLLKKQGFESYAKVVNDDLVQTYFYRKITAVPMAVDTEQNSTGWEDLLQRFEGRMQTIDVRQLEMPGPMMNILEALEKLDADQALFVYHKRIPVFLLPELAERKLDYRINEIKEGEVQLLIFKA